MMKLTTPSNNINIKIRQEEEHQNNININRRGEEDHQKPSKEI